MLPAEWLYQWSVCIFFFAEISRIETDSGVPAALTQCSQKLPLAAPDFNNPAPAQLIAPEQRIHEGIVVRAEALGSAQRIFVAGPVLQFGRIVICIKDMPAIRAEAKGDGCSGLPQRRTATETQMVAGNRYVLALKKRSHPGFSTNRTRYPFAHVEITSGLRPRFASWAIISHHKLDSLR